MTTNVLPTVNAQKVMVQWNVFAKKVMPCGTRTALVSYILCIGFFFAISQEGRFQNLQSQKYKILSPHPHLSIYHADRCEIPPQIGFCPTGSTTEPQQKYFYSTKGKKCKPFEYSGCGGSANMFDTREECKLLCYNSSMNSLLPKITY